MSETGNSSGSEPRRVDATLQRILDRAAAMGEGKPDPKAAGSGDSPAANPKNQSNPKSKPTPSAPPAPAVAVAPPGPTRIHPDKRGPLMLANALTEARGGKPVNKDALSYYSPELIQATLPHTDPKTPVWVRKNGDFALIVASGYDTEAQPYGIPYGAFPRLVLAHIITQVIAKHDRRVELSSRFGAFLKEIGYTGNHWGNSPSAKRIKDQLDRLLNARITFEYKEGDKFKGRHAVQNVDIAPKFDLWWDFKEPEQDSFFGSYIELSEGFYNAILARPVPLKTEVLKALHKDILALDVYMWVSYRLANMKDANQESLLVSYGRLQAQFGTGIAEGNYRLFRQRFKKAFAKVAHFWIPPNSTGQQSLLRHEFTENGITLYRSPLLVSRNKRVSNAEETAALLESRAFDDETRRQARFLAATLYSVEHLEKQYFAWIESKKLTPGNPRAHFLNFVKRHVDRNK